MAAARRSDAARAPARSMRRNSGCSAVRRSSALPVGAHEPQIARSSSAASAVRRSRTSRSRARRRRTRARTTAPARAGRGRAVRRCRRRRGDERNRQEADDQDRAPHRAALVGERGEAARERARAPAASAAGAHVVGRRRPRGLTRCVQLVGRAAGGAAGRELRRRRERRRGPDVRPAAAACAGGGGGLAASSCRVSGGRLWYCSHFCRTSCFCSGRQLLHRLVLLARGGALLRARAAPTRPSAAGPAAARPAVIFG